MQGLRLKLSTSDALHALRCGCVMRLGAVHADGPFKVSTLGLHSTLRSLSCSYED